MGDGMFGTSNARNGLNAEDGPPPAPIAVPRQ